MEHVVVGIKFKTTVILEIKSEKVCYVSSRIAQTTVSTLEEETFFY